MPNNEVHSDHSYERYGNKASDLHRWMDEPYELYGVSHRWSRHNTSFIPQIFIDKYGKELALAIMEDHILLDKRANTRENANNNKKSACTHAVTSKKYSVKNVRREYPNAYKKWTKNEDQKLVQEYKNGRSISELADSHGRKKGAIRSRLKKLGLID